MESGMNSRYFYQGYNFIDLTTPISVGKYQSRVAIVPATETSAPSQHFLDFEIFSNQADAQRRAFLGARAWIDRQIDKRKLSFPTRLASL